MSIIIPRVNINQELDDWANAVYGEEVRSANVSALTKLQTQINNACDAFENATEGAAASADAAAASEAVAVASKNTAVSAATRAEEAAGSVENPVSYDPQTLTAAQQEQVRKNIGAANSNRNLLDNGWFQINQRGLTTYSGSGVIHTVDRWKRSFNTTYSGCDIIVNTDGSLSGTIGSNTYFTLLQILDDDLCNFLMGKTVTMSIKYNGVIYSGSVVFDNALKQFTFTTSPIEMHARIDGRPDKKNVGIDFHADFNKLQAVKLELGSVSTLANDVAPNYAEELAKCQWYFERIKNNSASFKMTLGHMTGISTTAYGNISAKPKRAEPAVTYSHLYFGTTDLNGSITGVTLYGRSDNSGHISLQFNGSFTNGTVYRFGLGAGDYIDIDARL